jgi:hypothetical protein
MTNRAAPLPVQRGFNVTIPLSLFKSRLSDAGFDHALRWVMRMAVIVDSAMRDVNPWARHQVVEAKQAARRINRR